MKYGLLTSEIIPIEFSLPLKQCNPSNRSRKSGLLQAPRTGEPIEKSKEGLNVGHLTNSGVIPQ